jgi:hypothetical protein
MGNLSDLLSDFLAELYGDGVHEQRLRFYTDLPFVIVGLLIRRPTMLAK